MYDSEGQLIRAGKMIYTTDGHSTIEEKVWYDKNGKLEEKEKHIYEYDAWGNWIKRTTLYTEFDKIIKLRMIEYY